MLLYHITCNYITSHVIIQHQTESNHITSHPILLYRITSHHMTWNQYKLDFITSHRMSWHRIRPIMSCGRRRWGLTRLHDNELEDWRDIEKQCWSNTSSSTHVMLQMSPCTTRWRSIFLVLVREPYLLSSPLLSSPCLKNRYLDTWYRYSSKFSWTIYN